MKFVSGDETLKKKKQERVYCSLQELVRQRGKTLEIPQEERFISRVQGILNADRKTTVTFTVKKRRRGGGSKMIEIEDVSKQFDRILGTGWSAPRSKGEHF